MSTRSGLVYGLHASCSFAGGAGGGAFLRQRGFAAGFVRNGAGDYTLQLTDAIDATGAQHVPIATTQAGAAAAIDVQIVDATHIRVRTSTGAQVAADIQFGLMIIDQGVN